MNRVTCKLVRRELYYITHIFRSIYLTCVHGHRRASIRVKRYIFSTNLQQPTAVLDFYNRVFVAEWVSSWWARSENFHQLCLLEFGRIWGSVQVPAWVLKYLENFRACSRLEIPVARCRAIILYCPRLFKWLWSQQFAAHFYLDMLCLLLWCYATWQTLYFCQPYSVICFGFLSSTSEGRRRAVADGTHFAIYPAGITIEIISRYGL